MSSKDRQLEVHRCQASEADIEDLKYWAEQYGAVQTIFKQPKGPPIVRITFREESAANTAYGNIQSIPRHVRHGLVRFAGQKGDASKNNQQAAPENGQASSSRSNGNGVDSTRLGPSATATAAAQAHPAALAPAPRKINALPDNFVRAVEGLDANGATTVNSNGLDTWELSQMDSDYDDGYIPIQAEKIDYGSITGIEWEEAFLLVKDFALNGGAILAVDVEAWEHDSADILEVGLAHVNWKAGNGSSPNVRAEHIIIQENKEKRNGDNFYDRRDYFAFGTSQVLSQDDLQTKLNYMIATYTSDPKQPLVFLFHDAKAERSYFELMGVSLSSSSGGIQTRVPGGILRHLGTKLNHVSNFIDRSDKIVWDTQRLYQAYLMHWDLFKTTKVRLGLGNICKDIGVQTAALHNGGNDAVYTLKLFMRLVEMHIEKLAIQQQERLAAGPSYVSVQERTKVPPVQVWKPSADDNNISDDDDWA